MNIQVQPRLIAQWREVFENIRPAIQKALDHGGNTYSFEDLIEAVETKRFKLFFTPRAIILCEIIFYPQYCTLNFFIAAGDLADIIQLEPFAVHWGRQQGCRYAVLTGRPGWHRTLCKWKLSWRREPHVGLRKEL